ncbi:MAG TPA: diguanylate cyclase [Solirubrobacteraceae bacterium]|nr:diguanylate cyclase [Solirubrobacteraceae bacterium]
MTGARRRVPAGFAEGHERAVVRLRREVAGLRVDVARLCREKETLVDALAARAADGPALPDPIGAHAEADERTSTRDEAAASRDRAATDRDRSASGRDRSQAEADQRTTNRNRTASDRDRSQAEADQRTSDRDRAGVDRERAAADREEAAADRAAATHDRREARAELRHAQLDQLTGAFGRELGLVMLEQEIDRARRGAGRLVLAYVDVDGLKQVNDRRGHAAGDALLRAVAGAIQARLRSYDAIVRVGGDEFVCALGETVPAEAGRRFAEIGAALEAERPEASISVGLAALRPGDTLAELTRRGDAALYAAKRARVA